VAFFISSPGMVRFFYAKRTCLSLTPPYHDDCFWEHIITLSSSFSHLQVTALITKVVESALLLQIPFYKEIFA
jgi:hypothetical protein